jgi:putative exosortase-associated protein (TIGR04073 family)
VETRIANRVGIGLAAIAVLLVLSAPTAVAENTAARKMGRGLAGMTCGFLEIPGNVVKTTQERGAGYGFTLGFAKGLGALVVRELVGVYEFLSAPIEVPQGFVPILTPEFPWDYFE